MKKFTIIGLILAIMAVGVFLACAGASNKKPPTGSKWIRLKIDTETGAVLEKVGENNQPPEELTPQQLHQIYQTKHPIQIGEILYYQSSPGCIIVIIAGKAFQLCNFPTPP
jgi:hypothetical protein